MPSTVPLVVQYEISLCAVVPVGMATDGEMARDSPGGRSITTRRISDEPRERVHCACWCRGLEPSRLVMDVAEKCRRSGVPSPCATNTARPFLCKLHCLAFLILSLYYNRLITPEESLHLSAPLSTCSGRYGREFGSILAFILFGTEKAKTFAFTSSLVVSLPHFWVLTRRCRFAELSSPHRTVVASSFILLSGFPVTTAGNTANYRMQAKIVISRDLACTQTEADWRNARVGFLPARYRCPPSCCSGAHEKPTHTFCTRKSQ